MIFHFFRVLCTSLYHVERTVFAHPRSQVLASTVGFSMSLCPFGIQGEMYFVQFDPVKPLPWGRSASCRGLQVEIGVELSGLQLNHWDESINYIRLYLSHLGRVTGIGRILNVSPPEFVELPCLLSLHGFSDSAGIRLNTRKSAQPEDGPFCLFLVCVSCLA